MTEDDHAPAVLTPGEDGALVVDNRSPYMTLVGPILRRGQADAFALVAEEKHKNLGGVMHGGMLMTLLDNVMGRVVQKAAGDRMAVTIQLNTLFVSSVSPGETVDCEAQVVRGGRSIVFMRGTLRVGSRTVATADGVWKILDRKLGTAPRGD